MAYRDGSQRDFILVSCLLWVGIGQIASYLGALRQFVSDI